MRTVLRLTTVPAALLVSVGAFTPVHAAAPGPVSRTLEKPGAWTAERMRRAEAAPLDLPARAAKPQTAKASSSVVKAVVAKGHRKAPLKQIGRLYLESTDGRLATCSGTVVNSAYPKKGKGNGSVVLTAGHCLSDPSTGWQVRALVFVPDLNRKTTPYGIWSGHKTLMWSMWADRADPAYDYAFVAIARRSSGTLQKKTKAQRLQFDAKKRRLWVRLYGYAVQYQPRNKNYPEGGRVLRMCKGRTSPVTLYKRSFLSLKCNMSHGASGGPLITSMKKSGYGRIVGVTSFYRKGEVKLYSPILGTKAKQLFLTIRKVKVPVYEPPQNIVRVP